MSSDTMFEPIDDEQVDCAWMSVDASWRMSGRLPPFLNLPQPVIQHFFPTGTAVAGRQAVLTHSLRSKGRSSLSNAKSLENCFGLRYRG